MALITSDFDFMRAHEHQMALITSECVPFRHGLSPPPGVLFSPVGRFHGAPPGTRIQHASSFESAQADMLIWGSGERRGGGPDVLRGNQS